MKKKDEISELNKRLLDWIVPFDKLPKEIKDLTFEFVEFRRELTKESDRGCSLLAAAHLDYMFEKLLKNENGE